jgi:2-polyprenyl-3-methyl-5-hydroxy-6-metoxy-1,4-benzoquinol methylase
MSAAPRLHPAPAFPRPAAPSAESLCLKPGYRQQERNQTFDANRDDGPYWAPWRIADSAIWQYHVYRWAAELVTTRGLKSILDVGCGVCTKLSQHLIPVCNDIEALDQRSALEVARKLYFTGATAHPQAVPQLTEVDLESPTLKPARTFDLILCADVLEHLVDPDPALDLIRAAAGPSTLILLSTPDRERERGRDCTASKKPEHVREWSRPEFAAFVRSRNFRILASRLFPKDDSPRRAHRDQEARFRLRQEPTSKMSCQAVLCSIG